MLEVCIDNLESAQNAISGGADEIEICSALCSGGLTPSVGFVAQIAGLVKKLPIPQQPKLNVMLRCRAGDDFIYTEKEMLVMLEDIKNFKELDIDRLVFGALTHNKDIDEFICMRIIAAARPIKISFNRAFDHVRETRRAAAVLVGLGINRVLTSGKRKSASHHEALERLAMLTKRYINGDELIIMAGGGVTVRNVGTFIKMGCPMVHSSCRGALPIGVTASDGVYLTDSDVVRDMKKAIALARRKTAVAEESLTKKTKK